MEGTAGPPSVLLSPLVLQHPELLCEGCEKGHPSHFLYLYKDLLNAELLGKSRSLVLMVLLEL